MSHHCRDDGLVVAAFLIAAAAVDSQTNTCNCSAARSTYSEWDQPPIVKPPARRFNIDHLGYLFWGVLAAGWFAWLAFFQPTAPAPTVPADVAAPAAVAAPEPAAPSITEAVPAPVDPAVAPLDALPGALAALPPLTSDVLPSRELLVEPLAVAAGVAPSPIARPTQRRWWLGFVK